MSENFLESPGDKPIGTYKEVIEAVIVEFPGSEQESSKTVIVRKDGEHIADLHVFGPNDSQFDDDKDRDLVDNPKVAASPVTWFNIMGDDDMELAEFLMSRFGVEEGEM